MLRIAGSFFVIAGLAFAETQSGVVRSGGQAIPGAAVTAICGADKITTVTDEAGKFELGGLPATPCKFFISMFGFEPAQLDVTASGSPVTFDLKLQTRATLATEPSVTPAAPAAPPTERTRRGPGRGGFGGGRGGFGGGQGRGGTAAQGGAPSAGTGPGRGGPGFQSLNLTQNNDNAPNAGEVEPSPSGTVEDASGSNEAFLVNGSLSQGVQAQPGDALGLGAGPGAFGLQAGGLGGAGNPFGTQNNPGANGGLPSLAAGPGGGAGGGGGFGGGG